MARTPWSFASYSFPLNPNTDTDWVEELALSEQLPIGSSRSVLQFGGRKAAKRQTHGYIWGPNAQEQYNQMVSWFRNRTQATLTDHTGRSRKAMLTKFSARLVNDVAAYRENRITWEVDCEWTALD